ncbi:amidase [Roseinatronobacter sp. NSM]|uniref:amidase n=1 Tax=Roseinatronobacter sp. NSM TaxID=3457785 RepID=UPI0040366381
MKDHAKLGSDPADWSIVDTVDAVCAGHASAQEVTQAVLDRIARRQPVLNCFIRIDAERALETAAGLDCARATGAVPGPLHGAVLAHKDMYYRAGLVSTCGSEIRRDFVAQTTATVLQKLDIAGAVDVGTLNMSEFASGPTGHNLHYGDCHNPWNPDHITGGSSTGSGSAVGGRLVAGSLGSDTGGSVRLPAGICGAYGIKPTQGRVSRHGVMGLSFSLDNVGPIARTARDCARLLSVISGPDPLDTTALPVPVDDYEADLDAGVAGLRIAVPKTYYFDDMSPEISNFLDSALAVFTSLGAKIVHVDLPHHDIIGALGNAVGSSEQCTLHDFWHQTCPEKYAPLIRARMQAGFGVTAVEYLKALHLRSSIARAVSDAAFGDADVMFLPVLRFPVPTLAETNVGDGAGLHEILGSINHCTRPINYLGFPALTVPCGFSASGLPVAFQLAGPAFSERLLFRFAGAFEAAHGLPDRVPDLP